MSDCSNKHPCTCQSATCKNKGKCCDCVANHAANGSLPVCLRPIAEAVYGKKND